MGGASPYAPYNMESLINKFTNKYICFYSLLIVKGGLKQRTVTGKRGRKKVKNHYSKHSGKHGLNAWVSLSMCRSLVQSFISVDLFAHGCTCCSLVDILMLHFAAITYVFCLRAENGSNVSLPASLSPVRKKAVELVVWELRAGLGIWSICGQFVKI